MIENIYVGKQNSIKIKKEIFSQYPIFYYLMILSCQAIFKKNMNYSI